MKISDLRIISIILVSFVTTISPCHSQSSTLKSKTGKQIQTNDSQIAEYVVEIFEDSKGNLWFGTVGKGAAKFDGKVLTYFTTEDGLSGNTVTSFVEDKQGNIWFGTHSGLSKYNNKTFTNFTDKDGLDDNRVSELLIDKKGILWVGTWGGVSKFTGTAFSKFPIPNPDIRLLPYQTTMNWITEILEDKDGNIWFGRDGYGACKYDGASFTHYSKRDGLASNNIQVFIEDKQGNIWFGSRVVEKDNPDNTRRTGDGGLTRFDGNVFIQFPEVNGLSKNEIYAVYEDRSGNIWIGANGFGIYRYDGEGFRLFTETDKADLMTYGGIQCILEDKKGNVWFGLSGGLFRLKGDSIINVLQNGPWD